MGPDRPSDEYLIESYPALIYYPTSRHQSLNAKKRLEKDLKMGKYLQHAHAHASHT